jgi:mRNA degradation ribonuclease J1/J2
MRERPQDLEAIYNNNANFVYIVLSGWAHEYEIKHDRYFKILYSSHCAPHELTEFVKTLKPKNLIFNMNECGDEKDKEKRLKFEEDLVSYT